jgi:hypothetical protein
MKPFENFLYFTGIICCCWWLEHETNEEIELDEFIPSLERENFPQNRPGPADGILFNSGRERFPHRLTSHREKIWMDNKKEPDTRTIFPLCATNTKSNKTETTMPII